MADEGAPDDAKNANPWTEKQRALIAWLALPSWERMPLTQALLAHELRVHEITLTRWRKLPGFEKAVMDEIRASLGDVLHEVVGSFKSEARKGEFAHQKMYFEMLGWYTPAQRIEGEVIVKVTRMNMDDV